MATGSIRPRWRPTTPAATHPLARHARHGIWALLAVLLVLATVSGLGATYLLARGASAGNVAAELCDDLRAQNYDSAARLLSTTLRADHGASAFIAAMRALDSAEGPVVACHAGGATANSPDLTSIPLVLTRGKLGDLSGVVQLRREDGSWQVATLPTALLGVNYGALRTTLDYCAALQASDYATAYALLAPAERAGLSAADYASLARAQDSIDGVTRDCALAAAGQSNSDAQARLTLTLTRARLSMRTGIVGLAPLSGSWRVVSVDTALQGTDLGPLRVGESFCADLASHAIASAYTLTSAEYRARVTLPQFAARVAPHGARWTGCQPDLTTYRASEQTASYAASFSLIGSIPGERVEQRLRLTFAWEGGGWWLASVTMD